MPPKRPSNGFIVPTLPSKRLRPEGATAAVDPIRAESERPASPETSPANDRILRPRSRTVNQAPGDDKRLVPEEERMYGRNKNGTENTHLIVFEPGTQDWARIYSLQNKKYWRCVGCRPKSIRAEFHGNDLYVPLTRFHQCQLKKYEHIRKDQEKVEKRFANACSIAEHIAGEPEVAIKNHIDNVHFNHPSSEWLRDRCDSLGVEYSTKAIQLWAKCNIEEIKTTSLPEEAEADPSTVYECISSLFTGDKRSAGKIEKSWTKNLSSGYKLLQQFAGHNFAKMSRDNNKILEDIIFANDITDFHLEFMARWFQCRVGIFEANRWKHFGNWSSSDYKTITILMKKEHEKYQIILTLD
uniref:Uncharacterized protein n=1 Tax=Panagrolaimus davidi TaxID=227884 RepID=A0A914PHP6_9BILA